MSTTNALVVSYLFVFAVIILATVLQKVLKLSNNFSRKLIHVGWGTGWWWRCFYSINFGR